MLLNLPLWQYVVIFLFAFLFGGLKSSFGIAGALVTPALSLLIEPRMAVALLGPLALFTDVAALRNHWGKWDKRYIWLMLPGLIIGALAGAFVLRGISTGMLNKTLAVLTLTYAAVQLWPKLKARLLPGARETAATKQAPAGGMHAAPGSSPSASTWMTSRTAAHISAFGGGILGTISHAGGVVMTFYLLAVGLRKETYIATLVALFFVQNMIKLPLYLITGVLTLPGLMLTVLTIPLVFLGGALGKWAGAKLSATQFDMAINGIMVAMGLVLLFK